jgi:hypothetical protein
MWPGNGTVNTVNKACGSVAVTVKYVAQCIPYGGSEWQDLASCDTVEKAHDAITRNDSGWDGVPVRARHGRPERYRVVYRKVIESVVSETTMLIGSGNDGAEKAN